MKDNSFYSRKQLIKRKDITVLNIYSPNSDVHNFLKHILMSEGHAAAEAIQI